VDCSPAPPVPDRLDGDGWGRLDALTASGEHWDLLHPSTYARPTPTARRTGAGTAPRARRRSTGDAARSQLHAVQHVRLCA
jgi:hypothetical protein